MNNFTEDLGNGISLEMIAIPGGSFQMGSEDFADTKPVHRVKLSPFHIGKFQVTQAQWQAVMGNNPSYFRGDDLPVEQVSWNDAVEFCEKLSRQTGKEYHLPTEAQFEYACLAGSTGKYCFGDDESLLENYAWYSENSNGQTHPVGEKKPNNWDLHDMHGNVLEWCSDWYSGDYYAGLDEKGEATNPQGSTNRAHRVLRGGSWFSYLSNARAVYRYFNLPANRDLDIGFRVVCCRPPSTLAADGALAPGDEIEGLRFLVAEQSPLIAEAQAEARELRVRLAETEADSSRLWFFINESGRDGLCGLDVIDFIAPILEERGHDEPTPDDELDGWRRLIDRAMQSAGGE